MKNARLALTFLAAALPMSSQARLPRRDGETFHQVHIRHPNLWRLIRCLMVCMVCTGAAHASGEWKVVEVHSTPGLRYAGPSPTLGTIVSGDAGMDALIANWVSIGNRCQESDNSSYTWGPVSYRTSSIPNDTRRSECRIPFVSYGGHAEIAAQKCPADQVWKADGSACEVPRRYFVERPESDPSDHGSPDQCGVGNPVNPATGNKFQSETDYRGAGPFPLTFSRSYNAYSPWDSDLGRLWLQPYSRRVYAERYQWRQYDPDLLDQSDLYGTPKQACESGWPQIRLRTPWLVNATAAYANDVCTLYVGGKAQATLQIQNSDPPLPGPYPVIAWRVERSDGKVFRFPSAGGNTLTPGVSATLEVNEGGFRYFEGDAVEQYDASGRLQVVGDRVGRQHMLSYDASGHLTTVTDSFGRDLNFGYDAQGRLSSLTDPADGIFVYGYDSRSNLASVHGPDGMMRSYQYEDARFPHALTGITDENGNRFASWAYDSSGRAVSSEHAGGAARVTLTYNANGTTTVMDALGAVRSYSFDKASGGFNRVVSVTQPCTSCGFTSASATYDSNGFVASKTDFNGVITKYVHDTRGLEESRTEGYGTSQARTISTRWHPDFRLPTQIDEPGRRTVYTYDSQGNRVSQIVTDSVTGESRTTRYTYTAQGLLKTIDGLRTDVSDITTYAYDTQGNLIRVTNALGQVIQIPEHDAHGNPLRIVDANGVETILAYDARQRLKSATVAGEVTQYDYDAVGQLIKVTPPDGSFLQYGYDAAHRLTGIQDNVGNRIVYSLDLAGNRTAEEIYDASNTLRRRQTSVYDALSRLKELHGASNQRTAYDYDANGNLTQTADPLNRVTRHGYDALDRLTQVTDAANGITRYEYNALNQLTTVTDPRGLVTRYSVNAFGEVTRLESPDSGVTLSTYDSAGNLTTRTDAKDQTTTYEYDALNRLTKITDADDATVTYTYDEGTNGIGRLTGMTDASGSTSWTYDAHGRLTQKAQTINGRELVTRYSYNGAGQLTHQSLPSGKIVHYEWLNGQVVSVKADTAVTTGAHLAVEMSHHPFGPPATWRMGNGKVIERVYDLDGRLSSHSLGTVGYDAASRITGLAQGNYSELKGSKTYEYDALNRLTRYQDAASTISYDYDANGNRIRQGGSSGTVDFSIDPASNRLLSLASSAGSQSFEYDANGSLVDDGLHRYTYDAAGRLQAAGSGTYRYNGLGQRVQKTVRSTVSSGVGALGLPLLSQPLETTTLVVYDEAGHLIGEYDGNGTLIQETAWLGDLPLAVLKPDGDYYIHPDHLNTPRQIDALGWQAVWAWDTITFGGNTPSQPQTGAQAFEYNLRFAGQYYDAETGLFQNWHRDYSPLLGGYIQPDPLGLDGGSFSTYLYADANPLSNIDPEGLSVLVLPRPIVVPMVRPAPATQPIDPALPIPDTGQPPGDPSSPKCLALAEKIVNLRKEVYDKRIPDLEANPGNLPERIGPGERLRDTVRGHRKLLDRQLRRLRELEDRYAKECSARC